MTQLTIGTPTPVHLNGATIMTTPTDEHVRIARATGYAGVEVRAERLLGAPEEVAAAADVVRAGEVWSLNGIQLQLTPEGRLDRERLAAEMAPRLDICRRLAAAYLLVVPPRAAGADRDRSIVGHARRARDPARRGCGRGDRYRLRVPRLRRLPDRHARAGRAGGRRTCRASTSSSTRATGTRAGRVRSTRSRSTGSPWST